MTNELICENCGKVIQSIPRDTSIVLCDDCRKDRKIYCRIWHQKHKEYHNKVNRDYQKQYRESGKQKEVIQKFWSKTPKSKQLEYMAKYVQRKADKYGVTVTDINRLLRTRLIKFLNESNVDELIAISKEKDREQSKNRK